MNLTHKITTSLLLAILATGASAQVGLTRAEVKADLAEAIRTGDMPAGDDSGLMLNQENPSRYPAKVAVAPESRKQVKAELAEAIRTGNISAGDDENLMLNQENPSRYPAQPVVVGKTRQQVKSELAEAIRTGNISAGGERGVNLNVLYPNFYAKQSNVAVSGLNESIAERSSGRNTP